MITARATVGVVLAAWGCHAWSIDGLLTSPVGEGASPPAPWRVVTLPRQKPPATQFSTVALDGQRVLRVVSVKSYGNLLHPVDSALAAARLQWDWRVDRAPASHLRERSGDDVALKVCVFFDWPLERLPIIDRVKFEAAQAAVGEPLPTATLCYVWASDQATGTVLPNVYTRRLQMIVTQGDGSALGMWHHNSRDLHADFRTAFAAEWRAGDAMPRVRAVLIGADADNTGGEGLGYLRSITLTP